MVIFAARYLAEDYRASFMQKESYPEFIREDSQDRAGVFGARFAGVRTAVWEAPSLVVRIAVGKCRRIVGGAPWHASKTEKVLREELH
jgi:hypothetical protein